MRAVFLVLLAVALMPANAGAAQSGAEKSTAKRISNHIQQSGQLRNYRIGVTYQNGIATLAGTVTNEEQRDRAIALAEQVTGVKQVECKLQCVAAQGESPAKKAAGDIAKEFANEGGHDANLASAPSEPSGGVVQAYNSKPMNQAPSFGQNAPQQRMPMMHQGGSGVPMNIARQRQMPRNNMPLPTPRHAMDPAIRQASAQNCYQAGGACPPGAMGGGPGMMGPGMMSPGGMGPGSMGGGMGGPMPTGVVPASYGRGPSYENPSMPGYAWPSYASYPNYAALSYPQQYSPTAWPYIGPFYPYPQVPLAWRKVSLEWDDGWWFLDFSSHNSSH